MQKGLFSTFLPFILLVTCSFVASFSFNDNSSDSCNHSGVCCGVELCQNYFNLHSDEHPDCRKGARAQMEALSYIQVVPIIDAVCTGSNSLTGDTRNTIGEMITTGLKKYGINRKCSVADFVAQTAMISSCYREFGWGVTETATDYGCSFGAQLAALCPPVSPLRIAGACMVGTFGNEYINEDFKNEPINLGLMALKLALESSKPTQLMFDYAAWYWSKYLDDQVCESPSVYGSIIIERNTLSGAPLQPSTMCSTDGWMDGNSLVKNDVETVKAARAVLSIF